MHWRLVISYAVLIVTVAVGPFFLFSNREPKRIPLDAGTFERPVGWGDPLDAGPPRHARRHSLEAGVVALKVHLPDPRIVKCQDTSTDWSSLKACLEAIR